MLGTLVILPLAGYIEFSESGKSLSQVFVEAENIFGNNNSSYFMGKQGLAALAACLGGLSWGLGYLGQPHLLIRYMAIRNPKDIRLARNIAIVWAIPGIIGAFFIGVFSLTHFGPEYFQNIDPEQAMPLLASKLLHPILAGLFISGAVAAMMSTADSQLLVSTSAVTEDLFHQYLKKDFSEKFLVKLSRLMIVVLGLIAYGIAIISEVSGKNIFSIVSYAWSGLGAAFGPALVLTLWWKKTTRKGVIAGLITGFLVTIIWSNIPELKSVITERFSSFTLSFIAVYIVSIKTKNES